MRQSTLVLTALTLIALAPETSAALPAWARKYNMKCASCHYPAVPRLNATGFSFKWAGYRMPNEIGENMEVKKMEEYFSTRGILQYSLSKTQREPADVNGLSSPAVSVFAAGGLGKNYGAYFELERQEAGNVDLVAIVSGVWGKEGGYGGVRAGTGHLLVGGALAGFDRPTGILVPLPLAEPTTAGIPFRFAGDQAGVEAFYVIGGKNRTSVQILNGLSAPTSDGSEGGASTKNDVLISNQFMWDDAGSGVTAIGYFGRIAGLDATAADLSSRYYRLAATANKFLGPFEVLGGYVYSNDSRLPLTTAITSVTATGSGYWVYGGYSMPKTHWTVFGRYEFLDPNRNESDDGLRRVVVGSVIPATLPEYLRLGVEYFRDLPQLTRAPRRNGISFQLFVAF